MENHDCRDIADKLYALFDGELAEKEQERVLKEVEGCMYCLERYDLEKRFIKYLKSRIEKKNLSKDRVQGILNKIEQLA